MSSSGINFGGLSSGIDTEGIISSLMRLERQPITRIQQQKASLLQKQALYNQLSTKFSAISQAASALNIGGTFNPVSAMSSSSTTAMITAAADTAPGTYNVAISRLASAHKVGSSAQADTTSALGIAGQFAINGKTITIDSSDSLRSIASKINDRQSGVTASIIDGGAGNAYLTINSSASGAAGKIQMADVSGSVLNTLGVLNNSTAIRQTTTNGALGLALSDSSSSVGTLIGATGLGSQTVQINGTNVSIDLSVDSLQAIASRINTNVANVTATVESVTVEGTNRQRLKIVGNAGTPTFVDAGETLTALGILQKGDGNPMVAAQDASFSIDGISLTSSTNVITTAVPGATITLLKANQSTPETATLTVSKDQGAIKQKIDALVSAYNDTIGYIDQYSQFDKDSFNAGPLFGDSVAQQFESTLTTMIFSDVTGLSGTYRNLASIGFGIGEDGKLTVDDAMLTKALNEAPENVRRLFQNGATTTNPSLTYVSSTTKSVPSDTPYAVNVTQLATKSSFLGTMVQLLPSTAVETLTFDGALFGSTPITLALDIGSTAASTVSKINSDPRLKDLVTASLSAGRIMVEARRYGSASIFTLSSNLSAALDNSGIGIGTGTATNGVDIAGTIGGQAATGYGQYLSGASGNSVAEGLQVLYTGTTLGNIGTIQFSKGIGMRTTDAVSTFTDLTGGLLKNALTSIESQITSFDDQIANIEKSVKLKETSLRERFARMEEQISKFQSQGARLSSLNQNRG